MWQVYMKTSHHYNTAQRGFFFFFLDSDFTQRIASIDILSDAKHLPLHAEIIARNTIKKCRSKRSFILKDGESGFDASRYRRWTYAAIWCDFYILKCVWHFFSRKSSAKYCRCALSVVDMDKAWVLLHFALLDLYFHPLHYDKQWKRLSHRT